MDKMGSFSVYGVKLHLLLATNRVPICYELTPANVADICLAEVGILLATEPSERWHGVRQHIEIAFSSLKRVFRLGETLATTLVGLAIRIAAKICAYTCAFLVNRHLDRPQGRIKELWA
jgi:hypothetical protein